MYDFKEKLLPAVVLATGLAVALPVARGQDIGMQFRGSEAVVSPVDVWTGDGWYSIGQAPLMHAKLLYYDAVYEKSDGDTGLGTEKATLDFGDGDELQLTCRYVLEFMTNPDGISRIFSTCNVVGGKGIFQSANGMLTYNGSYGPGMSFPGMTPDGLTWYCTGETSGTILGVDPKAITDKLKKKAPRVPMFRSILRRR